MTDNVFLYNTDFQKAIKKNIRNSAVLVLSLSIIMMILGYLMGAFIEQMNVNSYSHSYQGGYEFYGYNQSYQPQPNTMFEISRTGVTGALLALVLSMVWTAIAIISGNRIILFSANAKPIQSDDKDSAVLFNVVQEVAIAAGIPAPKVYIMETDALNAFATGMTVNNSAVAITRGLLEKLTRDELQGVIAHEIGHVINLDIRYQTLVSIIVGLVVILSDVATRMVFYSSTGNNRNKNSNAGAIALVLLVFSIIAPIAALIIQMAVSRQREYLADATSVKLTRNPLGLISALKKLTEDAKPFDGVSRATQHLFIVNPFKNVAKIKGSLFSTHPLIEDRVARLKNLGNNKLNEDSMRDK